MEQKTSHIATMKYGAQVVKGELKSVLLDHGDTHKYDLDHTCNLMRPADCVDLMNRTGTLMNLLEKEHSAELASSLLTERHSYVLIHICGDDNEGHKYVSLLNDLNKNHPELADILRKMSNPSKDRDRRSSSLRKGCSATQSRGKKSVYKKTHRIKL